MIGKVMMDYLIRHGGHRWPVSERNIGCCRALSSRKDVNIPFDSNGIKHRP
jgi:hypothetical protein